MVDPLGYFEDTARYYAMRAAASDDAMVHISKAIIKLSRDDDGLRALIAAGACKAVADALRSARSDDATAEISALSRYDAGHCALITAGDDDHDDDDDDVDDGGGDDDDDHRHSMP